MGQSLYLLHIFSIYFNVISYMLSSLVTVMGLIQPSSTMSLYYSTRVSEIRENILCKNSASLFTPQNSSIGFRNLWFHQSLRYPLLHPSLISWFHRGLGYLRHCSLRLFSFRLVLTKTIVYSLHTLLDTSTDSPNIHLYLFTLIFMLDFVTYSSTLLCLILA